MVGCSAVPVPFVGRCADDIAGPDADDVLAMGLYESRPFGDIKGLAERVRMPGGVRAGREVDGHDADARRILALHDWVDPNVAGEPLGGSPGGRLLWLEFHGFSFVVLAGFGRGVAVYAQRSSLTSAVKSWFGEADQLASRLSRSRDGEPGSAE